MSEEKLKVKLKKTPNKKLEVLLEIIDSKII
jgi:hypothetical protein